MAHAASSALILYAWKSSSYPIGHITGKKSSLSNESRSVVSTSVTSPTYPMSSPLEYFFSTFNMPPSLPLIPHALTPSCSIIDTRLLLTLLRTISAISIVGSSVTLKPFLNSGVMPDFSTHLLISLPPP